MAGVPTWDTSEAVGVEEPPEGQPKATKNERLENLYDEVNVIKADLKTVLSLLHEAVSKGDKAAGILPDT